MEWNYDTVVNYLPKMAAKIAIPDEKFLFFFNPELVDEKFLFGITPKTGAYIFSVVILIQAIGSFFKIFTPDSFWIFILSILATFIYFVIGFYSFYGVSNNKFLYIKVSYLIIGLVFLIEALIYILKSLYKIVEFITPWDGAFLDLDFLIYVFGNGVFLFIYLYLIYIFYRFMLQVKNGKEESNGDNLNENDEEKNLVNEDEKKEWINLDDFKKNKFIYYEKKEWTKDF